MVVLSSQLDVVAPPEEKFPPTPAHLRRAFLQALEVLQRTVGFVEDESKYVLSALDARAEEGLQVRLVGDLERHLAPWPGHLELEVLPGVGRGLREVEGDAAQRELQVDLLVVDGAGPEDRKGLGGHRHREVHRGYSLVRRHFLSKGRGSNEENNDYVKSNQMNHRFIFPLNIQNLTYIKKKNTKEKLY